MLLFAVKLLMVNLRFSLFAIQHEHFSKLKTKSTSSVLSNYDLQPSPAVQDPVLCISPHRKPSFYSRLTTNVISIRSHYEKRAKCNERTHCFSFNSGNFKSFDFSAKAVCSSKTMTVGFAVEKNPFVEKVPSAVLNGATPFSRRPNRCSELEF